MIIPELQGGLGNVLFQLASNYSIAKQTGHELGIYDIPMPPEKHSKVNYSETILKPWLQYVVSSPNGLGAPRTHNIRQAGNGAFMPINEFKQYPIDSVLYTYGYWQYYEYIEPYKNEILSMIDLNTDIVSSYTDSADAYFLHVRRGDYVGNQYYELNLQSYYKKGIERIGTGIAYIVSNDIPWCETWSYLDDVRHRIIQENDVDTLSLMTQCAKGGIAANSTFSWWGLYLNTARPYLIIPNRWYMSDYCNNFAFPGTIVETIY